VVGAGAQGGHARLGVVCAGKTYRDVLGALEACGVGPDEIAGAGIAVLRLAMTFPLVPASVLDLCGSVDEILVIEEKRPFVEQQVRAIVHEAGHATPVRGKRDREGAPLVPLSGELTADRLVPVLTRSCRTSRRRRRRRRGPAHPLAAPAGRSCRSRRSPGARPRSAAAARTTAPRSCPRARSPGAVSAATG
jgi:indolepyruvate ferredoxin oxidoreductase